MDAYSRAELYILLQPVIWQIHDSAQVLPDNVSIYVNVGLSGIVVDSDSSISLVISQYKLGKKIRKSSQWYRILRSPKGTAVLVIEAPDYGTSPLVEYTLKSVIPITKVTEAGYDIPANH